MSRQYAAAYATHDAARDLAQALQLYQKLMASQPGAPEADCSRMQIHNIVNSVVPKQELLDAEMKRVLVAHFAHDEQCDAERIPVAALASGVPA